MKKIKFFLLNLLCVLLVLSSFTFPAQAQSIIEPHILITGDKNDQLQAKMYSFESDGTTMIPLKISENGAVVMQMYVENGGFINMNIYKESSPSENVLPDTWSCQCTGDLGNRNTCMKYFEKGIYYIRFPKNKYQISLIFYTNRNVNIQNNTPIAAYADYHHPVYYTYKAKNDGYITIQTSNLIDTTYLPEVTLCNNKKNPITDPKCNHEATDTIVYAVKKDITYQIKVTSKDPYGSQYYQFSLKYTARKENSGNSKNKAVSIKLGKAVSGLVFAEDTQAKEDWYKIKIGQQQTVTLYYSGSITSGSMLFDVFDAKGKSYASYSVVATVGTQDKDSLSQKGEGKQLPKGTYYIRIKKSGKKASGIYTIKLVSRK